LVEEGVRRVNVADETRRRAWIVLETANRVQAKGSSVRLVVPRAPEMTYELEPPLSEDELLAAEEYLLQRGYLAPANIGLRWGSYTITPAGFYFLERGLPEPRGRLGELAEKPGEEVAFEAAVQSELEEERRRMEELKRELEEERQGLQEAPEMAAADSQRAEKNSHAAAGDWESTSTRRAWWRRMFSG
jgi:hypothetical protein